MLVFPLLAASGKRVRFLPRFTAGETLRYQIESRTTTTGKATEPIQNPEGSSQLTQTANLVVRLDVLGVEPGTPALMGKIHMKATYEKSSAKTETDGYDPTAQSLEEQYNRLEGRSMEFTVGPDGKLSDMKGIEDVLENPSAAGAARSWMSGIASGAGFPKDGIIPGQRWSNERPLDGTPLGGLIWRSESTYLRDEPCGATSGAAGGAQSAEIDANTSAPPPEQPPAHAPGATDMCALILTRFEIVRGPGGAKGDDTPEDYRRNGLRTTGVWTGAGQSLDSISLSTSLLISSTQTSKQDMNFDIVSATAGSKIHYAGHVDSESQITLLPQEPPS